MILCTYIYIYTQLPKKKEPMQPDNHHLRSAVFVNTALWEKLRNHSNALRKKDTTFMLQDIQIPSEKVFWFCFWGSKYLLRNCLHV